MAGPAFMLQAPSLRASRASRYGSLNVDSEYC